MMGRLAPVRRARVASAYGSYTSALTRVPVGVAPPATSTVPPGSLVAVHPSRGAVMLPAGAKMPVVGSYTSALARAPPPAPCPPANRLVQLRAGDGSGGPVERE